MNYLERWVGTALKELPRQGEAFENRFAQSEQTESRVMEKKPSFQCRNWTNVKINAPVVSLQRGSDGGDSGARATVAVTVTEEPLLRKTRNEMGVRSELKQTCRRSVTKASLEAQSQKMVF